MNRHTDVSLYTDPQRHRPGWSDNQATGQLEKTDEEEVVSILKRRHTHGSRLKDKRSKKRQ